MADQVQDQVLGRDAAGQLAVDPQLERLGPILQQRLRGQHVLDFAGADAEGHRAHGAVRGGVAVAADDRHAGLRQAQLRADDVDDPLLRVVQIVEPDAKLLAVVAERVDLLLGDRVEDRQRPIRGRNVMVGRGHGPLGPAHFATGQSQTFESLGAGDLVNQMEIDIQNRRLPCLGSDDVGVPNFVEHRARGSGSHQSPAKKEEEIGRGESVQGRAERSSQRVILADSAAVGEVRPPCELVPRHTLKYNSMQRLRPAYDPFRVHSTFLRSPLMALRTTATGLTRLLNSAAGPVYVLDDQQRLVFLNRACAEWVGCAGG